MTVKDLKKQVFGGVIIMLVEKRLSRQTSKMLSDWNTPKIIFSD